MNEVAFGQLIEEDGAWIHQLVGSVEWVVIEKTDNFDNEYIL